MYYWTCEKYRNGVRYFIKDIDSAGYPLETTDENEAWCFTNFNTAMSYFNMGYSVMKH